MNTTEARDATKIPRIKMFHKVLKQAHRNPLNLKL